MREEVTEQQVAQIWQHQLVSRLVTDAGEKVCVIFPGRPCSDGGSDFCDAVLTIGDKTVKGNIEIHVKLSQWYRHGHHKDNKYNNVVLHVVMWCDCAAVTVLQNGSIIPSVFLNAHLVYPINSGYEKVNSLYRCTLFCQRATSYFANKSLSAVLTAAGEERFASKAIMFQRALVTEDAGQVLFKGIARALGYEKNAKSSEYLADILPLKVLEKRKHDERGLIHQALILGSAGLLPFQRSGRTTGLSERSEIVELEAIWHSLHSSQIMNQSDWHFFRVRPCNFPTRRLVALSFLINRYSKGGLLEGILNLVKESPDNKGYRWIEDGLIIIGHDYWANHSDFGIKIPQNPALLGSGKAAEITVNIILPFAHAWGTVNPVSSLREKAKRIFLSFPKLESNQLIRFMKQQLLLRPDFSLSASQQQGLLHIFKNYCRHRDCKKCPVTINPN